MFFNNDVISLVPGGLAYGGACPDMTGINGNIKQDPQFVDAARNNYHLQASSPAIDTGIVLAGSMPDKDLDGNGRIGPGNAVTCLGLVDMGAYEFGLTTSGTAFLPSSLDLGAALVGSNTNSTFISVPVQGCIQLSSVKTTGDFQQSNFCGGSIGAASACSIQVTFAPTSDGLRTGSLNFDFGTSSPAQTVTLTGTGFQPQLPTSPGGLTFAPQTLQTTSAAQSVTTLGGFTPPLQVNGIWISGDFSQTNNCSQFNFGSNCVFSIVFTPTAAGLRTGSLIINTNQGVANVPLSGTGLNSASATLTPFSLVFPDQLVNTLSAAQPVTLSNTGVTSFVPGVITISGDFAADSSQCQVPLAPGSSCVYAITFKPSAIGTQGREFSPSKQMQGR